MIPCSKELQQWNRQHLLNLIHHLSRSTKIIAAISSFSYILPYYWIDNIALTLIGTYISFKHHYQFPLYRKANVPFQTQETGNSLVFLHPTATTGGTSLPVYFLIVLYCNTKAQRINTAANTPKKLFSIGSNRFPKFQGIVARASLLFFL